MRRIYLTATLALCTPVMALASGPAKPMTEGVAYLPQGGLTYEVFETAIEHADLENCPAQFDSEANFCRITLANEQAHIFVFSHGGNQPLLAVKSYDLCDDFLPF